MLGSLLNSLTAELSPERDSYNECDFRDSKQENQFRDNPKLGNDVPHSGITTWVRRSGQSLLTQIYWMVRASSAGVFVMPQCPNFEFRTCYAANAGPRLSN